MDMFLLPLAASPWPVQILAIMILALFGVLMVWQLILMQNKSTGLSFKNDYWPEIKKSPIAVVLLRLGIYALFGWLVATLLSRFA